MKIIEASNLTKEFMINKKEKGFFKNIKNLFFSKKEALKVIDDISFSISKGEIVGYIGPNGAGKSTTIKILSGILHPTKGHILINGISPQTNRIKVVREIGVVFGQKTQLYWDLKLGESFELLKRIYNIDNITYKKNIDLMNELLGINEIIETPVRQLSLGQRMRGDLAASFLHSPKIIFLDEPTIGLDIQSKKNIRKFIKDINKENKVTIILTTHDLDDVEELCSRLIIIDKGKIVLDGALDDIINKIAPYRMLIIDTENEIKNYKSKYCELIKYENNTMYLKFDKNKISASKLISKISKDIKIIDLSVKEPNIEDVIENIYGSGSKIARK